MLPFLFNLQLKLKNTVDVCIFGELPFPSTDGEETDQGNANVQPELINKEGRLDDKVQEKEIEEGVGAEGGDDKEDMSTESQDAQGKNGYKTKERNGEDQDDKEARTRPKDIPFLNVEPQYPSMEHEEPRIHGQKDLKDSALNVAKEPEGISHPSGSLWESGINIEASIIMRSDLKDGVENRKQGEELQMSAVGKLSEQTENTNINDNFDVSIQSPHILSQPDPTSSEKENEEKEQLVMSTLAVPSIHFRPIQKRKELPSTPEYKKTRKKVTPDKGLVTAKKESTEEVKIVIQPEDEHPGDDENGNENDGDEDDCDDISPEDLLCFSWQIAQGMVSRQPKQGYILR